MTPITQVFSLHFRALLSVLVVSLGASGCDLEGIDSLDDDELGASQQAYTSGPGPFRGHEDLTRIAIGWANGQLQGGPFYPNYSASDLDPSEDNPLAKGNRETDDPSSYMRGLYPFVGDDWHTDSLAQNIHSLRNYPGGRVESRPAACWGIRALVEDASHLAMDHYRSGHTWRGHYLTGHALHIVQDSFSRAHTRRSGANHQNLNNVCTYGEEFPGVCYHHWADAHDRVWQNSWKCQLNPNRRGFNCLKPDAQSSVRASHALLMIMANEVRGRGASSFEAELGAYLDRYFNCSPPSPPPPGPGDEPNCGPHPC